MEGQFPCDNTRHPGRDYHKNQTDTLNKLGVVNRHLDTLLLRGLHSTATRYMDKCIDVHELTEKEYEHDKEKAKADKKRKCKDAANETPDTFRKRKKRRTAPRTIETPRDKRRRPVQITTETPRGKKRRRKV